MAAKRHLILRCLWPHVPRTSHSNLRLHLYDLKPNLLKKHCFCPLSVETTYICNMIWFKKMPSTKSMYKVRLSWLLLPNGPNVFTCEEGDVERKGRKSHPTRAHLKLFRAKTGRARVG